MNSIHIIEKVLDEAVANKLHNVIKNLSGSENVQLTIECGSKKGDNFMGDIRRILFQATDCDTEQSSLILKTAPIDKFQREFLNSRQAFIREIKMYDKVLAYFNQFQISKGITPSVDGFKETPICYSSLKTNLSECLFLEDLKLKQFDLLKQREELMSFDHMSLFMKAVGKFHAISFAIKDQQPEKFEELSNIAYEHYWTRVEEKMKDHFDCLLDRMSTILEQANRADLSEKFNRTSVDYMQLVKKLISSEAVEPYAVICHGDLTINNMMFCMDQQGKPTGIQLIDWQFTRYASPVIDLVVCLFCCSTKELRDKHYDEFIKIYHQSLFDFLSRLGSDPQKLFPFDALLDQLKKIAKYAIFVGCVLFPIFCVDDGGSLDMDNIAEMQNTNFESVFPMSEKSKQIYHKKVIDMFDDMSRLGYI